MHIEFFLAGVVIAAVIYLIYRKSQKPGKGPRVGPKGTTRPGADGDR
jgi:hypothetical protein